MEQLIATAPYFGPIIVVVLTQLLKKIPVVNNSPERVKLIRFIAVVLSFAVVILSSIATGEPVAGQEIEKFVAFVLTYFTTQIPYGLGERSAMLRLTSK